MNCAWPVEELAEHLPAALRRYLAKNKINFYIIDALALANKVGLGNRINMVMQAVFFKLAQVIPVDEALQLLKDSIVKMYGKRRRHCEDEPRRRR